MMIFHLISLSLSLSLSIERVFPRWETNIRKKKGAEKKNKAWKCKPKARWDFFHFRFSFFFLYFFRSISFSEERYYKMAAS